MCFTSIVELSAACPLCLHGSAEKIALCHAQGINSPIALCVYFGLQIPPDISKPSARRKMSIYFTNTMLTLTKTTAQIAWKADKRFPS